MLIGGNSKKGASRIVEIIAGIFDIKVNLVFWLVMASLWVYHHASIRFLDKVSLSLIVS